MDEAVDEKDLMVEGCSFYDVSKLIIMEFSKQVHLSELLNAIEVSGQRGQPMFQKILKIVFQRQIEDYHNIVQPSIRHQLVPPSQLY